MFFHPFQSCEVDGDSGNSTNLAVATGAASLPPKPTFNVFSSSSDPPLSRPQPRRKSQPQPQRKLQQQSERTTRKQRQDPKPQLVSVDQSLFKKSLGALFKSFVVQEPKIASTSSASPAKPHRKTAKEYFSDSKQRRKQEFEQQRDADIARRDRELEGHAQLTEGEKRAYHARCRTIMERGTGEPIPLPLEFQVVFRANPKPNVSAREQDTEPTTSKPKPNVGAIQPDQSSVTSGKNFLNVNVALALSNQHAD